MYCGLYIILVSVNFEMINYLKIVRIEMLCITLTTVVECKSIFIIIIMMISSIISIIIFVFESILCANYLNLLYIILYFKRNY